jgi:DNA-directed RNA polymerase specialized sigma24 family protein
MATNDQGSVTLWLGALKAGDLAAAQPLWERYFAQLVRLARARLRAMPRGGRGTDADEEDAALSAFDSFCEGAARGRFPRLADRDQLWRLLVVLTARKVAAQTQRQRRQKRGSGRVLREADLLGADPDPDTDTATLEQVVGAEPSPDFAAMVAEECRRLIDGLGDEDLRRIAVWKMEGYSNEEIRHRMGCSLRTVTLKLALIRTLWDREQPA